MKKKFIVKRSKNARKIWDINCEPQLCVARSFLRKRRCEASPCSQKWYASVFKLLQDFNHDLCNQGPVHAVKELEVSTRLTLSSQKDYLQGDNSDIIATDSQKNTVYIMAKKYGVKSPEDFATILCNHFLSTYSHVTKAVVEVQQMMWNRVAYGENANNQKLHNHAFIHTPICTRFSVVTLERGGKRCADSENHKCASEMLFLRNCLHRKPSDGYQWNQRHACAENNSKFLRKLCWRCLSHSARCERSYFQVNINDTCWRFSYLRHFFSQHNRWLFMGIL